MNTALELESVTRSAPVCDVSRSVESARAAQPDWVATPIATRLGLIRRLRHLIAENADEWGCAAGDARQRPLGESLTAEVLPLLEACGFLERQAQKILAPKRIGGLGRPFWLTGVHSIILREPFGVVLIVGPANYPLFLPAVQALQALVAGNAVLLKPGVNATPAAQLLRDALTSSGLDSRLFCVLPEAHRGVYEAIENGVDKVVLTGSSEAGRAMLAAAAEALIPATMELSGCDAVFVREDADIELVKRALAFGLQLNNGSTCIAPRRVFAPKRAASDLAQLFSNLAVTPVTSDAEALDLACENQYALGATIFSRDENAARELAAKVDAGVVVINDMIVPTADPRLPFGGRHHSGFGVTRGAEGLLEMTQQKVITTRGGTWRPHLDEPQPGDAAIFSNYIRATHGTGLRARWWALCLLLRQLRNRHANHP